MLREDGEKGRVPDNHLVVLADNRVGNLLAGGLLGQHEFKPAIKLLAIAADRCQGPKIPVLRDRTQGFPVAFAQRFKSHDFVLQNYGFQLHQLAPVSKSTPRTM